MSNSKTLQIESFGITHVGLVREHNEDVWVEYPDDGFFILADGMGGHLAGEVASKEAADFLYALFKKWGPTSATPIDEALLFFKEAFMKVNERIYKIAGEREELKGMGTTLCSLFLHPSQAIMTHVGDSRIYRLGKKLVQLTEDHSLVAELASLGTLDPETIEAFPYKHILTKAIGTHSKVEPTVSSAPFTSGDLFMLCSDGLTNYVTHSQMEQTLQLDTSLPIKGQMLVDLALEQGGGDNVTLILAVPRV